jgi:ABC-type dipeptide/oligopeptide/nickel transport system ATPase component
VVVHYNGTIVEKGTIDEIVSESLHAYTKNLINSIPSDPTDRWKDKIE